MPTVGYHDVKDKDHWLASPKREEFFGPLWRDEHPHLRRPREPHARRRADGRLGHGRRHGAMETEAAAEAMEYDGVVPETLVMLVEA